MAKKLEDYIPVVMESGITSNKSFDMSGSTGTFKTPTGAATLGGSLTLAAGKSITGAAGAGAVDFSAMTGTFKFPTGLVSGDTRNIISGSGATATLTAAQTGSIVLFDRAAGIVFTLPAPSVGLYFDFITTVTITSGAAEVDTDAGSTFVLGAVELLTSASATTFAAYANGTSHVKISSNGTTTGGIKGSQFRMTCVSATVWNVTGLLAGSGVLATPFA